jgi:divalent metal cation (Fe/Co/Zn/Cd) transporter
MTGSRLDEPNYAGVPGSLVGRRLGGVTPMPRSFVSLPAWATHRDLVHAALLVSLQSVAWSAIASSGTIALGLANHTIALVALGAVGIVDGLGSAALVYHFHHARRHERLSERIERAAHNVVIIGLLAVGVAAVVVSVMRLATGKEGGSSALGTVLAAVSFVCLLFLSRRKRVVAQRLPSVALLSDSHLSAIGATQALVALLGAAAAHWLGLGWADAAAALLVGCVAIGLALSTWRDR